MEKGILLVYLAKDARDKNGWIETIEKSGKNDSFASILWLNFYSDCCNIKVVGLV